jgi:hypothetical protein
MLPKTPDANRLSEDPNNEGLIEFVQEYGILEPAQIAKLRECIAKYPAMRSRVIEIQKIQRTDRVANKTGAKMMLENLQRDLKVLMEIE